MSPAQQIDLAHTLTLLIHLAWLWWLSKLVRELRREVYMAGYRKGHDDGFDEGLCK